MFSSLLWQSALGKFRSLRSAWSPGTEAAVLAPASGAHPPGPVRSSRIAWLLYGLACFTVFFLLSFPAELLLQRVVASIERTAALRAHYSEGIWSWREGWTLSDLTIDKASRMPPLRLSRLALRPSLFSLLRGQPFPLAFSANLYDGTAEGVLWQEDAAFSVQFALDQLALEQWPFPAPWGHGRISGRLTAGGAVQGTPADIISWSGHLAATVADGALKAGNVANFPLPALQTAQVRANTTLKGGRLEISDLLLEADGIKAQLQGTIILRLPLEWSTLDLRLTTRTTGTPPPALATLISLLPAVPGAAGERRASITGTLAAPVVR